MANPFDQFDAQSSGNPFDRFDAPPTVTIQGKPDATAAETERMRRQFIADQGTAKTRLREFARSSFDPTQATAPADSFQDWAGRVVPESITKLAPRLAYGAYEAVKGQTDPLIEGAANINKPFSGATIGDKMAGNAYNSVLGLAQGMTAPTGLMGMDAAKQAWQSDPAGSALAMIPATKFGKMAIDGGISAMKPTPDSMKILNDYQKAIRPSVKGTAGSAAQIDKSNTGYLDGVYDVVEAKNNGIVKLGKEGENPTARLPKTLEEHLDATAQARVDAYRSYNEKTLSAGGQGLTQDVTPIVQALRETAANKELNVARPSAAKYANDVADRLEKAGTITPEQSQNLVAMYNSVVDWSKATPEIAANAMIDKSVATQLRNGLDAVIMSDENPGFLADRLKYGRLAQMEKEAAQRVRVAGRAAPYNLVDGLIGAESAGQLVAGIASLNPAMLAKAGGSLWMKHLIKKWNSPDFQIERMYKVADKTFTERPAPETPVTYPRPQKTMFDKSVGKEILIDQSNVTPINTLNLPIGDNGAAMNSTPRIPLNLPQGQGQMVFDPTTGTMQRFMKPNGLLQ